ncbi:MAG TPA: cupin domain-containing protein [Vicinamibacterales bacterium]|jgi:hypothetical protein
MSKSTVIDGASTTNLQANPISGDWVLEGRPQTRSQELARSHDLTSFVMVWDCTAGRFKWHYNKDETLVVLSGEAFITTAGDERRIGPGDVVFFPAGSSATWHVPNYIKKIAFLRHTMPRPLGFGVLAWNRLLRIMRLAGSSPSMSAAPLKPENAPASPLHGGQI